MVLYLSNNGIKFEVTTMFYLLLLWYIYLFVIENTKNGWWNWVLKPSISLVMYQANLLSYDLIILSFSLNMFLLKMPKNCWVNFGAFQHSLDGWNPWLYAENGRVGITGISWGLVIKNKRQKSQHLHYKEKNLVTTHYSNLRNIP